MYAQRACVLVGKRAPTELVPFQLPVQCVCTVQLGKRMLCTWPCAYHAPFLLQLGELMLRCGTPATLMEVVVECQRRRTPFNDFSAGGLLPTDYHGNWTDERMERRLPGLELPLPQGWQWEEEGWEVDLSQRVDEHGWEYAINWPGTGTNVIDLQPHTYCIELQPLLHTVAGTNVIDLSWHAKVSQLDLVRCRRHVRHRTRPAAASDPLAERLVAIDVEINPPSVLVTISDGNERPPPYLLENRTELPLLLHQKGAPPLLRRTLQPHSRVPFVWDMPAGKRTLELCVAEPSMFAEVSLDQVRAASHMHAAHPASTPLSRRLHAPSPPAGGRRCRDERRWRQQRRAAAVAAGLTARPHAHADHLDRGAAGGRGHRRRAVHTRGEPQGHRPVGGALELARARVRLHLGDSARDDNLIAAHARRPRRLRAAPRQPDDRGAAAGRAHPLGGAAPARARARAGDAAAVRPRVGRQARCA